eukprot:gene22780-29495_t
MTSDAMVEQLRDQDVITVVLPEDVLLFIENPVICSDGSTYERSGITKWLKGSEQSPITNLALVNKFLIRNVALRQLIQDYKRSLDRKL